MQYKDSAKQSGVSKPKKKVKENANLPVLSEEQQEMMNTIESLEGLLESMDEEGKQEILATIQGIKELL